MVTHKCSAYCFALFPSDSSLSEGEMTQVQGVGKVLRELSLGKFLIGAEILCGLVFFLCVKAAVMEMPFCVLLWFHQKDEDIYNMLFIWKDLTMYPVTRVNAHFFQLHYPYTSENVVWLRGWSRGCSNPAGTQSKIFSLLPRQK